MYRLTDYGSMLQDRRRIDAYTRALAAVITPDSVVLDLGCGIGTFSILACKLGAARVYAVEPADVINVAREHARTNGVADRITFLQAHGQELDLSEQVDVIVADLAGALPLFEEHLPSVISVRDRFLKPGGTLIPQRDRLLGAPISSADLYARIVEPWRSVPGVDFGVAEQLALQSTHAMRVEPAQLAAEPQCWAELDYATLRSPDVHATIEWPIATPAVIHGIAVWFESTLHDGITFSSGPWSPDSVHATMVLPLPEPLEVQDHFHATIDATLIAGHYVVTWRTDAPASTYRINEHVLARRVGGEVLLLDTAGGVYHVLNETGTRVWELLERGAGVDEIAVAVASDYDVDPRQAAEDVAGVLQQLGEAKLIR